MTSQIMDIMFHVPEMLATLTTEQSGTSKRQVCCSVMSASPPCQKPETGDALRNVIYTIFTSLHYVTCMDFCAFNCYWSL